MTWSLPIPRLAALTVRVAAPRAPAAATTAAEPSVALPCINITVPAGGAVPVTADTVDVICTDAVEASDAGLAVRTDVVPTSAGRLVQRTDSSLY